MIPRPTLKILAGRAAAVALAALLGAIEKRGVPHDVRSALAVGGVALLAVVSQAPNLFAAAGIVRPLSPGQASLYQRLTGKLAALAAAPKDKRRQKLQEDIQAALADPETLQTVLATPQAQSLIRSQMLSRAEMWQPGQPVPDGVEAPARPASDLDLNANEPPAEAASAGADAASAAPATSSTTDASIRETGGNQ